MPPARRKNDAGPAYTRARNRRGATVSDCAEMAAASHSDSMLRAHWRSQCLLFQFACVTRGYAGRACAERSQSECPRHTGLLAETWFHRDPLAPLGAAARQHLLAALGLHARAKSMFLRSLAPVGLECSLGHEKYLLLIRSRVLRQTLSINDGRATRQSRRIPGTVTV